MNLTLPDMLMVGFAAEDYQAALDAAADPGDVDPEAFIEYKPFEECDLNDLRFHVQRLGREFNEVFADLYGIWSMLRVLEPLSDDNPDANCQELCERYSAGGALVQASKERLLPEIDAIRDSYLALMKAMDLAQDV